MIQSAHGTNRATTTNSNSRFFTRRNPDRHASKTCSDGAREQSGIDVARAEALIRRLLGATQNAVHASGGPPAHPAPARGRQVRAEACDTAREAGQALGRIKGFAAAEDPIHVLDALVEVLAQL
eukprot:3092895-Prymnesium_polylepis.1